MLSREMSFRPISKVLLLVNGNEFSSASVKVLKKCKFPDDKGLKKKENDLYTNLK